jgi:uncharacterized protein (TIGR03086 family)
MTADHEKSIDALERSVDQAAEVMAEVTPDQLGLSTPCDGWTVSDLLSHLVADPQNFIAMARGEEVDWSAAPPLPDDWASQFRRNAAQLLQMWRDAGEAATPQQVDWQTAEFAVHTWDLVRALGQPRDLDPTSAERGFAFMSGALNADNRGDAFAAPVPVDDGASAYDRLVAFSGRDPGWSRS